MSAKHPWYEKMFYRLQLKEERYFRLVFSLILLLIIVQFLLINPKLRRILVFVERLEGEAVHCYKP